MSRIRSLAAWWWASARHGHRPVVAIVAWWWWWVSDHDARDVDRAWRADITAAKTAGVSGRDVARMHRDRRAEVAELATPWPFRAVLAAGTLLATATGVVVAITATVAIVTGRHWVAGLAVATTLATAAWVAGRTHRPPATGPAVETGGDVATEGMPTAGQWMTALATAGVAKVSKAVEAGHTATWATRPSDTGHGHTAVLQLPAGATAAAVAKVAGEVSSAIDIPTGRLRLGPVAGAPASHLAITVLATDRPVAGPWPLTAGDRVDLWDVPIGVTADGGRVAIQCVERSAAYGGMTDTGKSKAMRLQATAEAMAGAELIVAAGKGGPDWEPLASVASAYSASPVPADTARFVRDQLLRMRAEGRRRAGAYRAAGWERINRDIITRPGLHLVAMYIDESAEVFSDPTHGAEIVDLATEIVKLFPAYGLVIRLATQTPDSESVPPSILKLLGLNVAFAVRDHHVTNAILGSGAHGRGWRPSELSQDDKGTAWVVTGGTGHLVQWHHVDSDQVRGLVAGLEPPVPIGPGMSRADAVRAVLDVIGHGDSGVRREDAWARLRVADPETWGGTSRPQLERLVACPSRSIRYGDQVRSGWSRTALEAALADEGSVADVAGGDTAHEG